MVSLICFHLFHSLWHSGGGTHHFLPDWYLRVDVKRNLDKLLFLQEKEYLCQDLSITIDDTVVVPTRTARSLNVTLYGKLLFSPNIGGAAHSCGLILHNIRRKGQKGAHPSACYLPPGLLQLPHCRSRCLCHQNSTVISESCCLPAV